MFIIVTLANFLLDAGIEIGHAITTAGSATSLIRRNINRTGRLRRSIDSLAGRITGLASTLGTSNASNASDARGRNGSSDGISSDLVLPTLDNDNMAMALSSSPL